MSNDKEINETSEKKLQKVSKQKKQGRESDQVIKSDQKNGPNRSNDGKKRKFCRRIHKPRKCPLYAQECRKSKKKIYWMISCYTKNAHEASAAPSDDFVQEEVTSKK